MGPEMPTLFDGTYGTDDIAEILDRMHANSPWPSSISRQLWQLRRATDVAGDNRSRETLLEKAVAMLAENGHMPDWFNQCPAASGIGNSADTGAATSIWSTGALRTAGCPWWN